MITDDNRNTDINAVADTDTDKEKTGVNSALYYRLSLETIFAVLFQEFDGNFDLNTVVYRELTPPILARYIRFLPLAFYGVRTLRVEIYGVKEGNAEVFITKFVLAPFTFCKKSRWCESCRFFTER